MEQRPEIRPRRFDDDIGRGVFAQLAEAGICLRPTDQQAPQPPVGPGGAQGGPNDMRPHVAAPCAADALTLPRPPPAPGRGGGRG